MQATVGSELRRYAPINGQNRRADTLLDKDELKSSSSTGFIRTHNHEQNNIRNARRSRCLTWSTTSDGTSVPQANARIARPSASRTRLASLAAAATAARLDVASSVCLCLSFLASASTCCRLVSIARAAALSAACCAAAAEAASLSTDTDTPRPVLVEATAAGGGTRAATVALFTADANGNPLPEADPKP